MFFILLLKVLPLYVTILIGYIAGRYVKVESSNIANVLFYIMSPLVVFFGIAQTSLNAEIISLPILIWFVCCLMSALVYLVSYFFFVDNTRNILAFSSGSSSMGFFGLPVALALFDEKTISVYVVCYVGMLLFENTFGFYIAAKGIYTARECLVRIFKLPAACATVAALMFNYYDLEIPEFLFGFMNNIRSTFMILGMMLLGICIANIKIFTVDWKFVVSTVVIKYLVWPSFILALIFLDQKTMKIYNQEIYRALILLAIIPISGSGMILATVLKYQPDKIAIMLLINTIIGLVYVPLMISFLLF